MKLRFAHVVIFLLFTCLQDGANAASPSPTPDQQRIRVLVELLASRNTVCGYMLDRFPKSYDRKAQAVVYLAIQQLLAEGSTAFDTLIEHFDDKRYCYTYAAPDAEYNRTVGQTCSLIMDNLIHSITNEQNERFAMEPADPSDKSLADWWKRNRHRPLWEIQVAGIDGAIALMERVRRDKTRLPWRLAEFLSPEVFESHRKDNLRILKGLRASIVAVKEPYRPKSLDKWLDDKYEPFLGLPWPTNPNRL